MDNTEKTVAQSQGQNREGDTKLEDRRRGFLKGVLAASLGMFVGSVPVASGLWVATDPLRRKTRSGVPFVRVANLEAVPADGKPRLFRVMASKQDAWNRHPLVPVGAVYIRRTRDNPDGVTVFNTVCPHLGCFVNAKKDATYHCPCHNSQFQADGSRGTLCVSARGLDQLNSRIEDGEILVQFQNFLTGKEERIPVL